LEFIETGLNDLTLQCFYHVYDDGKVEVKVMVKLFLCLITYHSVKSYGGVEVWLHAFLTSALVGGE